MIFKDGKKITRIFHGECEISNAFYKDHEVFRVPESVAIVAAINNRAVLEGFELPSSSQQSAMLNYIQKLVDMQAWDKFDLFLNFVFGHSGLIGYSRINWRYPDRALATFNGGLIWTAQGVEGNGVDGYIDPNYDPSIGVNNFIINNASKSFIQYTDNVGWLSGDKRNGNSTRIYSRVNISQYMNGSIALSYDFSGIGFKCVNRIDSNTAEYINKSSHVLIESNPTNLDNPHVLLAARSNLSFSEVGLSQHITASSIPYDMSQKFRTATNEFFTELGLEPIA